MDRSKHREDEKPLTPAVYTKEQQELLRSYRLAVIVSVLCCTLAVSMCLVILPAAYNHVQMVETQLVNEMNPLAISCGSNGLTLKETWMSVVNLSEMPEQPIGASTGGEVVGGYDVPDKLNASLPFKLTAATSGQSQQGQRVSLSQAVQTLVNSDVVNSERVSRQYNTGNVENGNGFEDGCCTCQVGEAGFAGPPGVDGSDGFPGNPGEDGRPGPDAPSGPGYQPPPCVRQCEQARPGPPGRPGYPGPKGPLGDAGRPANAGARGPPGRLGPPGRSGPNGNPGQPGPTGPPGNQIPAQGPPGQLGQPGRPGQPGQNGNNGNDGIAGPPGPPGFPGDPGNLGGRADIPEFAALPWIYQLLGQDGYPGDRGFPGDKGEQGGCSHCQPPRTPPGFENGVIGVDNTPSAGSYIRSRQQLLALRRRTNFQQARARGVKQS